MKVKKFIAVLLCLMLVLGMLPTETVMVKAAGETVYYVSASGLDTNAGTEEAPFLTIAKAVSELSKNADSDNTVKVIGEYELTNDDFAVQHNNNITIVGNGSDAKLNVTGSISMTSGPFTFENIIINYPNGSNTVFANGNEVILGDGVTTAGSGDGWWSFQNMISPGGSGRTSSTAQRMTINAGDYYRLYVGESRLATGLTCVTPGVDFTMNGGHVFQFILGGDGWDGMWGTNRYTDNVNLTFNGGSVGTTGIVLAKYGVNNTYFQGGTDFNGYALQIIMNNGKDITLDPGLTAENVEACNGKLYVLKCAEQAGSSLEATDVAGTYKVNGSMAAVATNGTDTYKSTNGTLTVPDGTYTVTWEKSHIYYVSASGLDTNPGTAEAPFLTIAKAVTQLSGNIGSENTVKIIGEYDLTNDDFAVQHNNNIIIEGNDSNAKVNIKNNITTTAGPFTFKSIVMNYPNGSRLIYACGNEMILEKGVSTAGSGDGWWSFQNMFCTGTYEYLTYKSPHKIKVNEGDYYRFYLGDSRIPNGQTRVIPGLNFEMNGGNIYQLILGGDGWDGMWGTNSYTDNVNLTFNGGSIGQEIKLAKYCDYFAGGTDFNGNALQLIFNNGTEAKLGTQFNSESVAECNGKLYQLVCEAENGSYLKVTDTAGEYIVEGDFVAKAINQNTGDVYKSNNGILSVKEGVYKVVWERKIDKVYLDSEYGNDDNDGSTAENAVKTLNRAVELSSNPIYPRITVVNKALYDNNITVYKDSTIYIEGEKPDALLSYGGSDLKLKCNLSIDNLILSQDSDNSKIYTKGHNLNIGKGVSFTHGNYEGFENPLIITGNSGNYERLLLAGTGCAGITIGDNGIVTQETRIMLNNTSVDKIEVDADDADATINTILDGGEIKALIIPDDATFKAIQVVANNGGSILGAVPNEKAWYVESVNEEGAKVALTDEEGKFNVTVPSGKVAVAINDKGDNAYVAGGKSIKDETPKTNYKNTKYTEWGCFDNNGSYLTNSYNKLTRDKKLKVAFFGGSLTNGFGCGQKGDPNGTIDDGINRNLYSWRALSCKWLKDSFPEAEITAVDAAIGESGTYLGTYRVQEDIISGKPDLLFVEYAINDNYFGSSTQQAAAQFETIIREVKEKLPDCDIVTVLTTDKVRMEGSYNGQLFDTAKGHNEISQKYGLPVVNIGMGLAKGIAEKENNTSWWNNQNIWNKYFYDVVHPYSTGHNYYYLCMEEFLENNLLYTELEGVSSTRYKLPEVQSDSLLDGDRKNIYGKDMQKYFVEGNSNNARFNDGIFVTGTSDTPRVGYYEIQAGGSITFDFTGTEFTVWSNINGNFNYKIDNRDIAEVAASTHAPTRVVSGLDSGEHRITITPTEYMQIAAIFTRDASKETKKGAVSEYADYKGMTIAIPAGKYKVYYVEKVGDLPIPEGEEGTVFEGWSDENGNLISSEESLVENMVLKAKFKNASQTETESYIVELFDIEMFDTVLPKPSEEKYQDWLFAGWYEDSECTEYIYDKTKATGKKYAKFVQPKVLTVKAQILSGTTSESKSTSMRIISTVDSINYRKVGFEISMGDESYDKEITTVYKEIKGKNGDVVFDYKPDVFCNASEYFSTFTLVNILQSEFGSKIHITPYWVTMDGTKVYGEERYVTVEEGYLK